MLVNHTCARGGRSKDIVGWLATSRVRVCVHMYMSVYVCICMRAGFRDSAKELETIMRSRALAHSPDHLFRTRTLAPD